LFSEDGSVYMEEKSERDEVIGDETEEEEKQDSSEPIGQETEENVISDNQDTKEKYNKKHIWSPQQRAHKESLRDQQIRVCF